MPGGNYGYGATLSGVSTYTSPDWVIDYFPSRIDGKSPNSYIYNKIYNRIASAIVNTQQRCGTVAALSTVVDTTVYANWYSNSAQPLSVRTSSTTLKSWQTISNTTGQNGITTGTINNTQVSSGLSTEYFYGQKVISNGDISWNKIGYRDYITSVGQDGSSIWVGNYISKSTTEIVDSYGSNPTYKNVGLDIAGSSHSLNTYSLKFTPYHSILLSSATNVPSGATTIDATIDRYPKWDSNYGETGFIQSYSNIRCRVIIGSSRSSTLGVQALPNKYIFTSESNTGTVTLPSGHTPEEYTLLGPGALMSNGTFFIPFDNDVNAPSHFSSVYNLNKTSLTNRFYCYPGLNSPKGHAILGYGNNVITAHVFVIGLSKNSIVNWTGF